MRRDSCTYLTLITLAVLRMATPLKAQPSQVSDLVAKMPAESIATGQEFAGEIIKLGPGAVREIIKMIVPPGAGDDSKARFTLNGLANYVTRPGAKKERMMFSTVVVESLETSEDPQVKTFLINVLQLAGKEEAVNPLSKLLDDPELSEPAVQALVAIRTKRVVPALMKALPSAEGERLVSIVRALGELRAKAATKLLLPFASSDDPNLRRVALYALANIGDPIAVGVLAKAANTGSPYERAHATQLYLNLARRLVESGKKARCASICRELIAIRFTPRENNVVCDALAVLVAALKDKALLDLLVAVDGEDQPVREAALKLTQSLPGKTMTAKLVARMKQSTPEVRAAIVNTLGRRRDPSALPDLVRALKDPDKIVRLAAVEAVACFATPRALQALVAALETDQPEERKAAQEALLRIPGDSVLAAVGAALKEAAPTSLVALLQVLAARRASAYFDEVLAATENQEPSVRLAAIKALGNMADPATTPRLLDLFLKCSVDAEKSEAQAAVVNACRRVREVEERAVLVLAVMPQTTGTNRVLLLDALREIGGSKALAAVVADTKSTDGEIQEAAVRAMSEWDEVSAAAELLSIARTTQNPKHQVLALRGYIRVVGLPGNRTAEETVRMYGEALTTAKRPEEKKLILAGLSNARSIEALKLVAGRLDDQALAQDASAAAMKIVLPQKEKEEPLRGPEVVEALKKVVAIATNAEVRNQASEYLNSMPKPDEANLARGRSVKTSVPQQGDHAPASVVDGNSNDLDSSWWGAAWPAWLQVDLEKAVKIDSAHVFMYWDGSRYYPYTLDVSLDSQTWKTIVDMSQNTRPSTRRGIPHTFEPVEARYVRLNILKNSVNEAVHVVELKVYASGTAPSPEAVAARPKPDAEGFFPLFNSKDLTGWQGSTNGYVVENAVLVCIPDKGGLLYTEEQYGDFILRFDFKLTTNANNGIGLRFTEGNPAYSGMEIQVLDDSGDQYKTLQPYQYHGSIYGVVPCERGHQKPVGEWNSEEIIANGRHVTVVLNGVTIVDADLDKASTPETMDHQPHPGLKNEKGFIGFLGHGSRVEFRNVRMKELRQ
ncbi:MAG: DUF1080 domain-containing protein [Armatimonadetes bacterium]|nr:DUF1080 domain-containing protein [Armatimonadota bacterium]